MPRPVFLCDAAASPDDVRDAVAATRPDWIHLAEDHLGLLRWTEALGDALGRRHAPRAALERAELQLREPFLAAMAELGERHASTAWWASRVSERNPLVSRLFLRCCQLAAALELIEEHSGPLCLVVDSASVLDAVERRLGGHGRDVRRVRGPRPAVAARLRAVARLAQFLARARPRRRAGAADPPPPDGRPVALIRTWVDDACLPAGAGFRDRYFPGLATWLERRGFTVVTVPVLFNVASTAGAWRRLAVEPGRFLRAELILRPLDYAAAAVTAWRASRLPRGPLTLDGLDVGPLVEAERRRWAFDIGVLDAALSRRLPRRLAAAGWRIDLVIDPYENMISGKELILGFRAAMPQARLLGYQHSTFGPSFLCNLVTPREAQVAPLPDRIVSNGPFYADLLVRAGLPPERVVAGPALRFEHLFDEGGTQPRGEGVLVVLPLELDAGVELILKTATALAELPAPVWVKPHPMATASRLLAAAGLERLPPPLELVEGSMASWLPRAAVAVTLGSSAGFESVAAGVPTVVVEREVGLQLDPLAWHPELVDFVADPEALRERVTVLLSLGGATLAERRAAAQQVLERGFGRVSDATMAAFVDGLDSTAGRG